MILGSTLATPESLFGVISNVIMNGVEMKTTKHRKAQVGDDDLPEANPGVACAGPTQYEDMLEVYTSLGFEESELPQDFCIWPGAFCVGGESNMVNVLSFSFQDLSGSLSPFIGNITTLSNIWMNSIGLQGGLPEEISNLYNLRRLAIVDNNLSGTLPSSIADMQNLELLWVYGNEDLTGNAEFLCEKEDLAFLYFGTSLEASNC